MIYAVITNELGLFGASGGARRLPAVRLSRLQDRDPGPRLVLDAAGRRPVDGVRAAGVRDRRRRHARDPAHRRDAAVHLLRRLLDRGQLRAAGAAAARLRSRAEAGPRERADHEAVRGDRGAVRAADRVDVALDGVRRHRAEQQPAQRPHADRDPEDQARPDPGRRRRRSLARSVKQKSSGYWLRTYPTGSLFAQPVGYSTCAATVGGLEKSRLSDLKGPPTTLNSVFGPLGGTSNVGDDVYTTLDPKAQKQAQQELAGRAGLGGRVGSRTGAILTHVLQPQLRRQPPHADRRARHACQVNRATQGQYPPGSTFKVVTATAAIDSGKYTPELDHQRATPPRRSPASRWRTTTTRASATSPDQGADRQRQHGVRPGRRERRAAHDDQVHEALRLLLQAADRPSPRRDEQQPPVRRQGQAVPARAAPTRTSAASPSARAACW